MLVQVILDFSKMLFYIIIYTQIYNIIIYNAKIFKDSIQKLYYCKLQCLPITLLLKCLNHNRIYIMLFAF